MPSRAPPFRPRFTLALLYLAGFFLLYAMLFTLPELIPLLGAEGQALPPEEKQARAEQLARSAMQGKVWISFVAALATVGFAVWRNLLPGLRA